MNEMTEQRNKLIRRLFASLPGSVPYDNLRPINVPQRCDGQTLLDCVCTMHPHVGAAQWQRWFDQGHVLRDQTPVSRHQRVRGGEQYWHLFPDTVEPDVSSEIRVLWEDDDLIAVDKPAPLPVHPCGRFNLNTLSSMLGQVYDGENLKLVHRLDANTTGLMLIARRTDVATDLRRQFQTCQITKRYLVRCLGHPREEQFTRDDRIAKSRGSAGARAVDPNGRAALTEFRVVRRDSETTLLEAFPRTGRTNQIRIHLWAMGLPVVGDPAYLLNGQRAATQTLKVGDPPMCLHAAQLTITHPSRGETMQLASPNPVWASSHSATSSL